MLGEGKKWIMNRLKVSSVGKCVKDEILMETTYIREKDQIGRGWQRRQCVPLKFFNWNLSCSFLFNNSGLYRSSLFWQFRLGDDISMNNFGALMQYRWSNKCKVKSAGMELLLIIWWMCMQNFFFLVVLEAYKPQLNKYLLVFPISLQTTYKTIFFFLAHG